MSGGRLVVNYKKKEGETAVEAKFTLEEIKKDVAEIVGKDLTEDEDDIAFKASVVLLSSAVVGPSIERLAKFTGYPRSLISEFSKRLRENGIWKGGKIYANWLDPHGGVDFICDSMVAVGWMARSKGEDDGLG